MGIRRRERGGGTNHGYEGWSLEVAAEPTFGSMAIVIVVVEIVGGGCFLEGLEDVVLLEIGDLPIAAPTREGAGENGERTTITDAEDATFDAFALKPQATHYHALVEADDERLHLGGEGEG